MARKREEDDNPQPALRRVVAFGNGGAAVCGKRDARKQRQIYSSILRSPWLVLTVAIPFILYFLAINVSLCYQHLHQDSIPTFLACGIKSFRLPLGRRCGSLSFIERGTLSGIKRAQGTNSLHRKDGAKLLVGRLVSCCNHRLDLSDRD